MSLPKISAPLFELTLPSSGESIQYRPFLVKEQKILMMAMESEDQKAMMNAVKQIINNCSVTEVDVNKLPIFDLEFFFLRLRAKSIGEEVELNVRHPTGYNNVGKECDGATKFKLNLMNVEVEKTLAHMDKIVLDESTGVGVKFKYPTSSLYEEYEYKEGDTELDVASQAIIGCIDYIFDKDNIYKREDSTKEELVEFLENLSQEQFQKLNAFFETMPKLKHNITWKCAKCGVEEKLDIEGLANFFG